MTLTTGKSARIPQRNLGACLKIPYFQADSYRRVLPSFKRAQYKFHLTTEICSLFSLYVITSSGR